MGHVNPESAMRQLTKLPNPPLLRGLCRSLGSYLVFAIFCFSLYFSALSMLEEPTKEPFYHKNHSENQSHIQSWFSCSKSHENAHPNESIVSLTQCPLHEKHNRKTQTPVFSTRFTALSFSINNCQSDSLQILLERLNRNK